MANNSSVLHDDFFVLQFDDYIIILQILVAVFFSINMLLFATFFKKECFYTSMRYILFAVTLLCDSVQLVLSYLLLILVFYKIQMQVVICFVLCFMLSVYVTVTPVTLTAMTLERYVAVCIPLHHAQLCSTHSTMQAILIIHAIGLIRCIVFFSAFFASVSLSFYKQAKLCSIEIFTINEWHDHIRSAMSQFYFLIMCTVVVFCYVKILKAAKAASGDNKNSNQKALQTVILHAIQLFLCLIQLCCPLIENVVYQINFRLFVIIRLFNYIMFSIAPRCLSPLIYGLRDRAFFLALKSYAFFGLLERTVMGNRNAH
ncbi:odorant receptor 131-2-like [Acanthochromis polyacanthus]|uniref:odorant receptor 131-2-like n=1 Tax=Acanthochromis polyacanthus TaxID=80966 RepID=UPI000B904EA1|nr:odorant receptor 131-2-like [Acanthochromis polyacanthus]